MNDLTTAFTFDGFSFSNFGLPVNAVEFGFFVGFEPSVLIDESGIVLPMANAVQTFPSVTGFLENDDFFAVSNLSVQITEVNAPRTTAIFVLSLAAFFYRQQRKLS